VSRSSLLSFARRKPGDVASWLGSRLVELKCQLRGDFPENGGGGSFLGQFLPDCGEFCGQCIALGSNVPDPQRSGLLGLDLGLELLDEILVITVDDVTAQAGLGDQLRAGQFSRC
jgi:hypothetical protein